MGLMTANAKNLATTIESSGANAKLIVDGRRPRKNPLKIDNKQMVVKIGTIRQQQPPREIVSLRTLYDPLGRRPGEATTTLTVVLRNRPVLKCPVVETLMRTGTKTNGVVDTSRTTLESFPMPGHTLIKVPVLNKFPDAKKPPNVTSRLLVIKVGTTGMKTLDKSPTKVTIGPNPPFRLVIPPSLLAEVLPSFALPTSLVQMPPMLFGLTTTRHRLPAPKAFPMLGPVLNVVRLTPELLPKIRCRCAV